MALVEDHDVVETFATDRTDPALDVQRVARLKLFAVIKKDEVAPEEPRIGRAIP